MNTPAPLNPGGSSLKIPHRDGAAAGRPLPVNKVEKDLAADFEALREREANLREYEERLRAWQAQLDARGSKPAPSIGTATPFLQSPSQMPFSSDSLLASSWEKFHRARALLESEQKQMRDERMMMREAEISMKRREVELAAREAALAAREKQLLSGSKSKKGPSAIERLTKAPFFGTRSGGSSDK